jgi:hypothetical protein
MAAQLQQQHQQQQPAKQLVTQQPLQQQPGLQLQQQELHLQLLSHPTAQLKRPSR